jgi:hypothetical protein
MTQNARQLVLICNVAAVLFGGLTWLMPASKEPGVWWFRIGGPIVLILATSFYLRATRRRDKAPDFLSRIAGSFFERDGFAFMITTEVAADACHLCVWYQNRYEKACEAEVMVRTSERWLAPQRHLPDARVKIECQPAAFGKALVPWPLPVKLQGRKVLLDVMAKRKYRHGRGKLLRYRAGLAVGSVPFSAVSDALSILAVMSLHGGGRAARTEIQLPQNVSSSPTPDLRKNNQTIWKLGDPIDPSMDNQLVASSRVLHANPAA